MNFKSFAAMDKRDEETNSSKQIEADIVKELAREASRAQVSIFIILNILQNGIDVILYYSRLDKRKR